MEKDIKLSKSCKVMLNKEKNSDSEQVCGNQQLCQELEMVIESFADGIYITDGQGYTLFVNKAYENITGLKRENLLGKHMRELEKKGIISQSATLIVLKNKKPVTILQQIKSKIVMVTSTPYYDENGKISKVITNVRDMTKLKALENELNASRELTKQYQLQIKELEQSKIGNIVIQSEAMLKVYISALRVAPFNTNVLIQGESGVGKEVFARIIHENSKRNQGPFIKINCGAIPENLLETELFGYEKGAFTGSNKEGKIGLFELAEKGTLLLDEIGDLPLNLQVKLLHVLQDKTIKRVGGLSERKVDVRVIAATNQNLEHLVKEKHFRSDLFYRLCTLPLSIPPLRTRGQDILILFDYFAQKLYKRKLKLEPAVKIFLENYSWPGNIRELENVVKYMCSIIPINETVSIHHLPVYLNRNKKMPVQNNGQTTTSYQENFELILQELNNQGLLKIFTLILQEIASFSALDKGLGRTTLAKRLQTYNNVKYLDHQLKKWFKTLTNLGLVSSGKTKQGTRITPLGQAFLEYLKNK